MKFPACPTKLSPSLLDQFQHDGYLAFPDVLSPTEVATARAALSELVQRSVHDADFAFDAGGRNAQSKHSRFFVQFEPTQQGIDIHTLTDHEIELRVRKLMWFCEVSPFFETLASSHPRIRGVVESLLGANPIRFQDMALIKPPFIGSEKPWHQDNAYFAVTPLEAVLGVWIALDDATADNGCMHVLVGEHKLGPRKHYHRTDCEIILDRLNPARAVPVELPAGGAMFFAGMLPHRTPPNASPHRRRALQFHYRSAASRIVPKDEYDKVYAEPDGTPASCAASAPTQS
jgi:phytanoyl-CoA hydroxylase